MSPSEVRKASTARSATTLGSVEASRVARSVSPSCASDPAAQVNAHVKMRTSPRFAPTTTAATARAERAERSTSASGGEEDGPVISTTSKPNARSSARRRVPIGSSLATTRSTVREGSGVTSRGCAATVRGPATNASQTKRALACRRIKAPQSGGQATPACRLDNFGDTAPHSFALSPFGRRVATPPSAALPPRAVDHRWVARRGKGRTSARRGRSPCPDRTRSTRGYRRCGRR